MSSTDLDVQNTKSKLKMKLKQYNSMQLEYNQMLQTSVQNQSKQGPPSWKEMNKTYDLMFLSTIGDWFWGTQSAGNLFSCKNPCDGKITPNSKQAYSVSTDGMDVYAAGRDDTLAKRSADPNAPGDWTTVPSPTALVYIVSTPDDPSSAFGNKLWGVDKNNKLYVCNKPCKEEGDWSEVKTSNVPRITWISVDNEYIWAVSTDGGPGSNGDIYKQELSSGIINADKWKKVGDDSGDDIKFTLVDASNSKYLIGTSSEGFVYQCEKPCGSSGKWKKVDSKPDDKALFFATGVPDSDLIYGSTLIDGIWTYDANTLFSTEYSWTDKNDTNAGGEDIGSNKDWMLLGSVDTLEDCKMKASTSEDAYSSIVYFTPQYTGDAGKSKSCYGMVYGTDQNSSTSVEMKKVVSSVPPDGISKVGGKKAHNLLMKMKKVQDEIAKLIDKVGEEDVYAKMSVPSSSNMNSLTESLNKNKGLINETLMKGNVFAQEEIEGLKENTSYMTYIMWLALSILCIYLCIYLVRNDASSIPRIVYFLLAIFFLYNIRAYFFAFSETSSNLLSSVGKTLTSV